MLQKSKIFTSELIQEYTLFVRVISALRIFFYIDKNVAHVSVLYGVVKKCKPVRQADELDSTSFNRQGVPLHTETHSS